MDVETIRLRCLELALDFHKHSVGNKSVLQLASEFFAYVHFGKSLPTPGA